jgi:hypothetical protein
VTRLTICRLSRAILDGLVDRGRPDKVAIIACMRRLLGILNASVMLPLIRRKVLVRVFVAV